MFQLNKSTTEDVPEFHHYHRQLLTLTSLREPISVMSREQIESCMKKIIQI